MQTYHEEMEGIPTYINKLEDAQKQSNRAGNPITDPTLLLFAANTMLRTNCFPQANEIWKDLLGADRTWVRWKTIYRKADIANNVKKAAQGGQDRFGAHGVFNKVPGPEEAEAIPQLSVQELDSYFSSLENAATREGNLGCFGEK